MDPITGMMIGSVAAPIIGGLLGANEAGKSRDAAEQARKDALAQYAGIEIPDIQSMMLQLEEYKSQGKLTPEMEQLYQQGQSALSDIQTDPRLKNEQMAALEQMSGLASGQIQNGDVAGFELARQNSAADQQAKQKQIMQSMQERGQGGSGAELLARLTSQQNGTQNLQTANLEQAKAMQAARLQALESSATMAGNIRSQDYGQAKDLASATDAINNFNTQNSQSVNSRNTATTNSTAAANLNQAQTMANANVDTRNKQQASNKALNQDQFSNQMALASAKAGQYAGMASANDSKAAQVAAQYAGIGQGVGTGLSALAGKMTPSTTNTAAKTGTTTAGDDYDWTKGIS